MRAYVIKRSDGKYWLGGFYSKDNVGTITQAKIYQNKANAEIMARKIILVYNIFVEVVPIEIREIED